MNTNGLAATTAASAKSFVKPLLDRLHASALQASSTRLAHAMREALSPMADLGVVRFLSWELQDAVRQQPPPGFTVREARVEELAGIAHAFDVPAGEFHRRAGVGDRCFAAWREGRPVHVRWVATRPIEIPELDLYACPHRDELYTYDARTLPAYRGQRANAAMLIGMSRLMLGHGFKRAFMYHYADDAMSKRAVAPYQRELFEIAFLRLRGGKAHRYGRMDHPLYGWELIPMPEALTPRKRVAPKP